MGSAVAGAGVMGSAVAGAGVMGSAVAGPGVPGPGVAGAGAAGSAAQAPTIRARVTNRATGIVLVRNFSSSKLPRTRWVASPD
jgi:hypothetical protein